MRCVRIWFEKTGLAKYISHLDVNRCFTRAVLRAEIPLWFTEGFNPRPYMSFLMPLPLGQEGLEEPLDIRIEGDMTNEQVARRLSDVMPDGINIVGVSDPVGKSSEIAFAHYRLSVEFAGENAAAAFCSGSQQAVEGGSLEAVKHSKRGDKTVNLCDMIKSYTAVQNGTCVGVDAVVSCGCETNLNCDLLMNTLFERTAQTAQASSCVRIELLCADGTKFR